MAKLIPPPIHMKPGSPAFTEWMRVLADYVDRLANRPNFAIATHILPDSYCCLPIIETKICQIEVEEREGDILAVAFYAGTWQASTDSADDYDYYLKLKRNNVVKKTLRGGRGKGGWDGNDRNVHGIHYHQAESSADVTWSVSIVLDDISGFVYPTLDGAGLAIQVR